MTTHNTRYDLTEAEAQAFAQATPEEIAAAAAELAQDPAFWAKMAKAFGEGVLRGLAKG